MTRESYDHHGKKVPRALTLDRALACRAKASARRQRSRPRERRERRTSRTVGSPGDPSPSDDPDLTPLQRGFLLVLEGLVAASNGGVRAYVELLDLITIRVAAEVARLAEWSEEA